MRTTIDERGDGRALPGRLIAVEGVDGSGKSTQIALLYKWLRGQGRKVFFSEWNSSELVRGATKRGKRGQLLTPTTFSLIHATDFADRYERQILPMLRAGFLVLVGAIMPAVLIETAFISNRDEAALLGTQSFQEKIAFGIADSVDEFFKRNEHLWVSGQ